MGLPVFCKVHSFVQRGAALQTCQPLGLLPPADCTQRATWATITTDTGCLRLPGVRGLLHEIQSHAPKLATRSGPCSAAWQAQRSSISTSRSAAGETQPADRPRSVRHRPHPCARRFAQALEALRGGGADPEWGDLSFCSLRLDGADAKSRKARARP